MDHQSEIVFYFDNTFNFVCVGQTNKQNFTPERSVTRMTRPRYLDTILSHLAVKRVVYRIEGENSLVHCFSYVLFH